MSLSYRVFVVRQREMGELRAVLDEALSGSGRLVMLAGEPGIGKTRIAQELVAIAEGRGVHVLWGRCYEGGGAPPYWPWVQAIRAYLQGRDAGALQSEMGRALRTLPRLSQSCAPGCPIWNRPRDWTRSRRASVFSIPLLPS